MRGALAIAVVLCPAVAAAEAAHPEELFLGEAAWLQERAELQIGAAPSIDHERWQVGATVEYGLTERFQLSLEGAWTDGAQMDVLRDVELGALFAPVHTHRFTLAVGASARAEVASEVEWSAEPMVCAALFGRNIGANLAVSTELGAEIEPTVALGLFARTGSVMPILEGAIGEGEIGGRAGLAVQLGNFEIAAAIGIGTEGGVSGHAALSWEIELVDDDDGDDDKDDAP